jgi:dihydroneopterin aldolase
MSSETHDKLIIKNLAVETRIGVYEWEQNAPQMIWIDLELSIDAKRAAARDDMREAIDYGRLVTAVKERVQTKAYRLLETVAEEVAALVLSDARVPSVRVRVTKRALPGIDSAAVELVRRRSARTSRRNSASPTAARRRRETRTASSARK